LQSTHLIFLREVQDLNDASPVILNFFVTYIELDYDLFLPNPDKLKFYITFITSLRVARRLLLNERH
jgi:hypothetical protein